MTRAVAGSGHYTRRGTGDQPAKSADESRAAKDRRSRRGRGVFCWGDWSKWTKKQRNRWRNGADWPGKRARRYWKGVRIEAEPSVSGARDRPGRRGTLLIVGRAFVTPGAAAGRRAACSYPDNMPGGRKSVGLEMAGERPVFTRRADWTSDGAPNDLADGGRRLARVESSAAALARLRLRPTSVLPTVETDGDGRRSGTRALR